MINSIPKIYLFLLFLEVPFLGKKKYFVDKHFVFPHVPSYIDLIIIKATCPNSHCWPDAQGCWFCWGYCRGSYWSGFDWLTYLFSWFLPYSCYLGANKFGLFLHCSSWMCWRGNWMSLRRIRLPSFKSSLKYVFMWSLFPFILFWFLPEVSQFADHVGLSSEGLFWDCWWLEGKAKQEYSWRAEVGTIHCKEDMIDINRFLQFITVSL